MTITTAHIIRNDEITLTECGLMLPGVPDTNDLTPQSMGKHRRSEVALWDNAETPAGAMTCPDCWTAYTQAW